MINLLVEPDYINNLRFKLFLDGLKYSIASKKGNYCIINNLNEIEKDERIILIIGSTPNWIESNIIESNKRHIHPILFGPKLRNSSLSYSYISKDYFNSFYYLCSYVLNKQQNKKKVALLGYNPNSIHDSYKKEAFLYAIKQNNTPYDIFENNGDSKRMIELLIEKEDDYDTIIASNDSLMILYISMSNKYQNKCLAAYGSMKLSSYLSTHFISSDIDYFEGGKIASNLYYFLNKQETIYPTSIQLPSKIHFDNEIKEEYKMETIDYKIDFYDDKAIKEIDRLEKLFLCMDETDIKLLKELKNETKYEDIADRCAISINTIKYRLNKMFEYLGIDNKKELFSILDKYHINL